VVFDAASIVTSEVPPLSLAIDGAHLGFDFYMENRQAVNDVVHAAVVAPAMDLVKLDVHARRRGRAGCRFRGVRWCARVAESSLRGALSCPS